MAILFISRINNLIVSQIFRKVLCKFVKIFYGFSDIYTSYTVRVQFRY